MWRLDTGDRHPDFLVTAEHVMRGIDPDAQDFVRIYSWAFGKPSGWHDGIWIDSDDVRMNADADVAAWMFDGFRSEFEILFSEFDHEQIQKWQLAGSGDIPSIGEEVVILGYDFNSNPARSGLKWGAVPFLSFGRVTTIDLAGRHPAKDVGPIPRFFVVDAEAHPGVSGGIVVNAERQVLGMVIESTTLIHESPFLIDDHHLHYLPGRTVVLPADRIRAVLQGWNILP